MALYDFLDALTAKLGLQSLRMKGIMNLRGRRGRR
jgi:hypothetical protein